MTAVPNTPSQAVMRRIGMVEQGTFDHPRVPRGTPCDRTSSTASTPRPDAELSERETAIAD